VTSISHIAPHFVIFSMPLLVQLSAHFTHSALSRRECSSTRQGKQVDNLKWQTDGQISMNHTTFIILQWRIRKQKRSFGTPLFTFSNERMFVERW